MDDGEIAVIAEENKAVGDKRDERGRFAVGRSGGVPVGRIRQALRDALMRHARDPAIDGEEGNAVWLALSERARRGDVIAMRLYLEYTAGKPMQEIEVTSKQSVGEMSDEDLVRVAEQAARTLV